MYARAGNLNLPVRKFSSALGSAAVAVAFTLDGYRAMALDSSGTLQLFGIKYTQLQLVKDDDFGPRGKVCLASCM